MVQFRCAVSLWFYWKMLFIKAAIISNHFFPFWSIRRFTVQEERGYCVQEILSKQYSLSLCSDCLSWVSYQHCSVHRMGAWPWEVSELLKLDNWTPCIDSRSHPFPNDCIRSLGFLVQQLSTQGCWMGSSVELSNQSQMLSRGTKATHLRFAVKISHPHTIVNVL